jgi:hypothetical protein
MRALAERVVEQSQTDATEEEDRLFVEAAGATLGLLLVDHAGDGAWVVRGDRGRMRVGATGFVDPFAIIEHALESDRPRRALAEGVALAEAEAAGTGPLARVAVAVETRLRAARPHTVVVDRFEALLVLDDGTQIDLSRIVAATRDQPLAAVHAAAAKFVDLLVAARPGPASTWPEAAPRLLPRLVSATFSAPPGAPPLLVLPLALAPGHDAEIDAVPIRVALVLAYEGRARYVRADEAVAWGHPHDALVAHAIRNLDDRSHSLRLVPFVAGGARLLVARSGDGLDSARLLLPRLRATLLDRLGSDVRLAVPHRDTLLACSGGDPTSVSVLRARAREDAARAPHRIGDAVLRLHADGLAV